MNDDRDLGSYIFERNNHLFGSRYKKYWFVLTNNKIYKYKNQGLKLINIIELDKIINIACQILEDKKYIELIYIHDIVHTLYFNDHKECDTWYMYINQTINKLQKINFIQSITVVDSIGDSCVVTDDNFHIVGYNKKAEDLFEYKKDEVINKHIRMFMVDYYSKYYSDIFSSKKIRKSGNITQKLFIKTSKGKKIPVSMSIGEHIFNEYFKRIYIHIFRNLEIMNESYNGNIEDTRKKIFESINQNTENLKNIIMQQFIIDNKLREDYIQNIKILDDENEMLTNEITDLKKKVRTLEDSLLYYKRKSQKINLIQILNNEYSYNSFLKFCKENKNEEAILFWKEVHVVKNKYINDTINDALIDDIKYIYDKFIKEKSEYEINISSKLKRNIKDNIDNLKNLYNIYDAVLFDIIQNINNNIFPIYSETIEGRKIITLLDT